MADIKKIKTSKSHKFDLFTIIVCTVLILYTISLFVPFVWGILTSFKEDFDYYMDPVGLPTSFTFNHYIIGAIEGFDVKSTIDLAQHFYIEDMIPNSIIYSIGSSFIIAASCCVTAYCSVQFSRFKISKVYTTLVVIVMALPIVGNEAASLQMYMNLKLYDHMWGMIIGKTSFLNMYYLVFHEAFKAVPKDFSEAAYIDGAGNVTLFFKLMLPFVSKTLMTVVLLFFIVYWNEYQVPLLYMPNHPTLAYGLQVFQSNWKLSSQPSVIAGCMILFIPIFVLFITLQKRLLGNVMLGGVKE